jgi:CubicO group peptidase (beta-lactamase class C family)
MKTIETKLQSILDKLIDNKKVFGTSFTIKKGDFVWSGTAGNFEPNQAYFIASTTKLFTSALIFKLRFEGKLNLEDKISIYLKPEIIQNLHIFKGVDYSEQITIKHLLAHTSGLPDYFQNKGKNGSSLEDELINGKDQYWTFEQCIDRSKAMEPLFAPGTKGKAHYSDTNYQLLGNIIETISGKTYAENCREFIIQALDLQHTYLYQDAADTIPKTLYYKDKPLPIQKAMTSFGADGGIVSTSEDMLKFIEAFMTGVLFPVSYISEIQVWNSIFFPMQAGIGIHLFKLPWYFNPFGTVPYFIGHSGLSGALAYYCPKKELYIVGTVNQVAYNDLSFRTMIKIALAI